MSSMHIFPEAPPPSSSSSSSSASHQFRHRQRNRHNHHHCHVLSVSPSLSSTSEQLTNRNASSHATMMKAAAAAAVATSRTSSITLPLRQRTAIACQYCRRRKIRCSGYESTAHPSSQGKCLNCRRLNQVCLFTPVSNNSSVNPSAAATVVSSSTVYDGTRPITAGVPSQRQSRQNSSSSAVSSTSSTSSQSSFPYSLISAPPSTLYSSCVTRSPYISYTATNPSNLTAGSSPIVKTSIGLTSNVSSNALQSDKLASTNVSSIGVATAAGLKSTTTTATAAATATAVTTMTTTAVTATTDSVGTCANNATANSDHLASCATASLIGGNTITSSVDNVNIKPRTTGPNSAINVNSNATSKCFTVPSVPPASTPVNCPNPSSSPPLHYPLSSPSLINTSSPVSLSSVDMKSSPAEDSLSYYTAAAAAMNRYPGPRITHGENLSSTVDSGMNMNYLMTFGANLGYIPRNYVPSNVYTGKPNQNTSPYTGSIDPPNMHIMTVPSQSSSLILPSDTCLSTSPYDMTSSLISLYTAPINAHDNLTAPSSLPNLGAMNPPPVSFTGIDYGVKACTESAYYVNETRE